MSTALVATLAACAGAAVALVLAGTVVLLSRRRRSRADLEAMLVASQREVDDLRHRLDALTEHPRPPVTAQPAEFVITQVGEAGPDTVAVPDRMVLSATVGEPLVRAAAFTHGVRRALSAEARNRIWFEMRREVRAARKRRRRRVKQYLRETRAHDRADEGVA